MRRASPRSRCCRSTIWAATRRPGRLADGITEDIITDLARFREFDVIARNSTAAYKGKAIDVRQIGKELGVGFVLEGSIQRQADQVRVTAQLIEADTGAHVWSDRWDRPLAGRLRGAERNRRLPSPAGLGGWTSASSVRDTCQAQAARSTLPRTTSICSVIEAEARIDQGERGGGSPSAAGSAVALRPPTSLAPGPVLAWASHPHERRLCRPLSRGADCPFTGRCWRRRRARVKPIRRMPRPMTPWAVVP